jgi:hypothetical protein
MVEDVDRNDVRPNQTIERTSIDRYSGQIRGREEELRHKWACSLGS